MANIPNMVRMSQNISIFPTLAAAHVPRRMEAMDASDILGSASRQKPCQKEFFILPRFQFQYTPLKK
jgi:hypothetical protein